MKKGDPLQAARLAGIMAAKQTSSLIPLCHPLPLRASHVELTPTRAATTSKRASRTTAQTGVEMEALTAVAVAALTIYDMVKAVDKTMVIGDIRLMFKSGGRSGTYIEGRRAPPGRQQVRGQHGESDGADMAAGSISARASAACRASSRWLASLASMARLRPANRRCAPVSSAPVAGYRVAARLSARSGMRSPQGLEFVDGYLYEGTGLNGQSSIRKVQLETRASAPAPRRCRRAFRRRHHDLAIRADRADVAIAGGVRLRQRIVRAAPLVQLRRRRLGLTHDAVEPDHERRHRRSALPRSRRPSTSAAAITVTAAGRPVADSNELEYVNGQIFANVWTTDSDRADRSADRTRARLDRSDRAAGGDRSA